MSRFVALWLLAVCPVWAAIATRPAPAQSPQAFEAARQLMVDEEIVAAGVKDPRVIEAMRLTPRHEFVPLAQRKYAYMDMAMPIGHGQTISPPFVVAYMTEQLDPQPGDKVLEIGTGSGYQAAVLSPLVREVYTIEIVEPLARRAAETLKRLKYRNVFVMAGDGYKGWPEHAPFDKIIVTCSPERVPQPLVDQLKEGGRMVIPVGQRYVQNLYLLKKLNGRMTTETLKPTLFVPMTGRAEEQRQVLPDPARPEVRNGDFETLLDDGQTPLGWHYQRQMEVMRDDGTPSSRNYTKFSNADPRRNSQALQGMAADGRRVKRLKVTLWVRGENVRPGQSTLQLPALIIIFYDENRAAVGEEIVGPWRGTFPWREQTGYIDVPPCAREAILRIAMLGAVGEFSVDKVRVEAE